jgi:hypothetical protein
MWKELTVYVNYYTQITYLVWVKAPYDPNDILTLMDGLNLGACTVHDYNPQT